jgi:hypothetical protein
MAATIDRRCPECGEQHTFCLPDADLFDGSAEYEYDCPKTNCTTQMPTNDEWNTANEHSAPHDAVIVTEVAR